MGEAADILRKIDDIEYLLYEKLYENDTGIIEVSHRFAHPISFNEGLPFSSKDPRIAAINEKVFALARAEYEKLLEQLRAEFAALT